MAPAPVVTGLSPKEGPPGTKVTIRGEFLGTRANDLMGLTICGCDCLLSAEWKSSNKIIARTGPGKGKGEIIVTTLSGGVGQSTVQFRAYHETIGPTKESAVWVEESPMQSLAWGRRTLAPTGYTQEDPLGLSNEGNDKKFPEDLRDLFPDNSGDLSQENFSPGWFLLEHHHGTTFEDLKAGLAYLRRKVEGQKEGQLSFLKSNAGSVIDQLDTLMVLKEKFQEDAEIAGNDPIRPLEEAIKKSISESHNLFNDVLSRREKADSTRAALAALSRHRFLFCLPNSVERSANKEEYEIVVNDYARARNLFGTTEVPIFKKVLDEVDTRIVNIRKELHKKVSHMPQSVEHQKKCIKALNQLELQQRNSIIGQKLNIVDPAWDGIEARAKYLEQTLKISFEKCSVKENQQNNSSSKSKDPNLPPNRVLFCEEISELAASQLPDLWRIGQAYFTGELKGATEPKTSSFKRIILNSIEQFCNYLRAALLPNMKNISGITWPNNSSSAIHQYTPWIPHCLKNVRISYATLIRLDMPSEALDIILKLIDEIRLYCASTIFKKSVEKVEKLGKKETWEINVSDFPGATILSSFLEEIIVETLEEAQSSCLTPEVREGSLLEPQSDGQREISQKLQDILNAFCVIIESLADQQCDEERQASSTISQLIGFSTPVTNLSGSKDNLGNCSVPYEQRLLCCLANCVYSTKIFFPHLGTLFVKYGYPLPKLAIDSSKSNCNQLFATILETYVEHKSDPLVGTIEPSMYIGIFQWNKSQQLGNLRPYAHECMDNLIGVYSEIFSISPSLLRPVLEPIIQIVAEELSRILTCVQSFSATGAIQANVDIRLIRDTVKLYSNEASKASFVEALDSIPELSEEGKRKSDEILSSIKNRMKLQVMCFSVTNP